MWTQMTPVGQVINAEVLPRVDLAGTILHDAAVVRTDQAWKFVPLLQHEAESLTYLSPGAPCSSYNSTFHAVKDSCNHPANRSPPELTNVSPKRQEHQRA